MSGLPRCAIAAPSRKRTSPCTIEGGWITTSIRSYGRPKRKCASITSRPLFASVAESIVIFGPIDQVGCASASSGVDVRELVARPSAERAAARRQHEALGLAELGALEERRVLAVDRDQLAPAARARLERELAGGDEALLVRERERDAVLERPHRRREPGEADDGVQHDVRLGPLEQLGRVASGLRQRREPVDRRRPGRRGDELELGMRVDHLDRLAPDRAGRAEQGDPLHPFSVPPSAARHRSDALSEAERDDAEVRRRGGEEQRVEPVEHAAVAAEQGARVLHARVALEHRLEQVAERRRDRDHAPEDERLADRQEVCL